MKDFYAWRERARKAGATGCYFVSHGKSQVVCLKGGDVEMFQELGDGPDEFEKNCERALRRFAEVRLGWDLRQRGAEVGKS